MLCQQTGARDPGPTAQAQQEGFSAGTDQFNDVRVQADGSHGDHDQEFAQRFQWGKERSGHPKVNGDGGDEAGGNKVKDEEMNQENKEKEKKLKKSLAMSRFFCYYIMVL